MGQIFVTIFICNIFFLIIKLFLRNFQVYFFQKKMENIKEHASAKIPIGSKAVFNFDVIFDRLQHSNFMKLQLHRADRKNVIVNLKVYDCFNGGKHIVATSPNDQFTYYNKSTTIVGFKDDLKLLLSILYERINLAKECQYCESLFIDEKNLERTLCGNCISWSCVTLRENCIICKKSEYPTKFKCFTCLESIVCIKCCSHFLWKKKCPTCKKPEVKFGTKRMREEVSDDDERVEELSDEDEDD